MAFLFVPPRQRGLPSPHPPRPPMAPRLAPGEDEPRHALTCLSSQLLDSAVKLPMAPLAHPENVSHAFIENPLIRQVSALLTIPTPANLTLSLRPYAGGTSQRPPARRLQVTRILGVRLGGLLLTSAVYR